MKTTLKNLSVALMLAGMTIGSGAWRLKKSLSPTVVPAVICRSIRYRRKRWRMRKGQIIWNRI